MREPPPPDLNDPMVRQEQWHCYSAPSNPDLNRSAPEVGAWADWQRALPDDFDGRATKPFTLKEINATVNRVYGHPMFDTAVCAKAGAHCPPPDIAAVVWDELKLSNNPKLCNDSKLRESALAMVEEVVDAFHKPAPLLRPILKKDGTPVYRCMCILSMRYPSLRECTEFLPIACQRCETSSTRCSSKA